MQTVSPILSAILDLTDTTRYASSDQKDPLGSLQDHLNVVLSVTDGPGTERFYGDILGLDRIPDVDLPGERYMIRYRSGPSEIKFIVGRHGQPRMSPGLQQARGIRLLTLVFPLTQKLGIIERMQASGLKMEGFDTGNADIDSRNLGVIQDFNGNPVQLLFMNHDAPNPIIDHLQIGLGVSDLLATGKFLQTVLGLEAVETQGSLHRYDLGTTPINLWQVPRSKPTWVGRPHEILGMSLVQFVVSDVPAAREVIVARGGKIHTEPYVLGDLAIVMFVEGPDGILIEFGAALIQ